MSFPLRQESKKTKTIYKIRLEKLNKVKIFLSRFNSEQQFRILQLINIACQNEYKPTLPNHQ